MSEIKEEPIDEVVNDEALGENLEGAEENVDAEAVPETQEPEEVSPTDPDAQPDAEEQDLDNENTEYDENFITAAHEEEEAGSLKAEFEESAPDALQSTRIDSKVFGSGNLAAAVTGISIPEMQQISQELEEQAQGYKVKGQSLLKVRENLPPETDWQTASLQKFCRKIFLIEKEPEAEFEITGNDVLNLVSKISETHLAALTKESGTLGHALKDLKKGEQQKEIEQHEGEEIDSKLEEIEKSQAKVEELNRKILEIKDYLQSYLCKPCKRDEDHCKIKTLRCELERAMKCQKKAVKDLILLQRQVKGHAFKPIQLPTTLDEDEIPSLYGVKNTCRKYKNLRNFSSSSSSICSARIRQTIAEDNIALSNDRCELQRKVMEKQQAIEDLQEQVRIFQCELTKAECEREKQSKKMSCIERKDSDKPVEKRLGAFKKNADCLEQNICRMTLALNKLQCELQSLEEDRYKCNEIHARKPCSAGSKTRRQSTLEEENMDLKKQYKHLVQEFNRKDREIKDLKDCLSKKREADMDCRSPEAIELELLKKQHQELLDEQEEFSVIVKEQTRQIDEYRNKYLEAQQCVEEQKRQMDGMEMNNEQIQEQVNLEITRIKVRFQEKMREFAPLPAMLENEQIKVYDLTKKSEALERNLYEKEQELMKVNQRLREIEQMYNESNVSVIENLRDEIDKLGDKINQLTEENLRLEQNYEDEHERFNVLRAETAKLIARTNERAEATRYVQLERINKLEKELAKVRADATCDLAMREETIRKVEGRMKILSGNFEDAQCQIKQLRNHIVYLTKPEKKSNGGCSSKDQWSARSSFNSSC